MSQLLEEPIEANAAKDLSKRMMDKTARRSDVIVHRKSGRHGLGANPVQREGSEVRSTINEQLILVQ